MKRIIIATDAYSPQVNGVAISIEKIIPIIEKDGFAVTVIHSGLFFTIPFLFYPEIRLAFFPSWKIKKILKDFNPDYVHIATEGTIGLSVRKICVKKKIKFSTSYHTHFPHYAKKYIKVAKSFFFEIVYSYLHWFHGKSSAVMVSTKSLREELIKHNFENVVICPLGVDIELFKRNEQSPFKNEYSKSHPVFVYFGRIAKEKDVEKFLHCNLPGTKIVIGGGPQKNHLENKHKNIKFTGWAHGQKLVDLLSVCDVSVLPSKTETFGLTIVEALACGIPIAAHNATGPKDIITDGVDGFLDENLERAAIKCLSLSREKCREKALYFSWEESAKYFINNLVKIK